MSLTYNSAPRNTNFQFKHNFHIGMAQPSSNTQFTHENFPKVENNKASGAFVMVSMRLDHPS